MWAVILLTFAFLGAVLGGFFWLSDLHRKYEGLFDEVEDIGFMLLDLSKTVNRMDTSLSAGGQDTPDPEPVRGKKKKTPATE